MEKQKLYWKDDILNIIKLANKAQINNNLEKLWKEFIKSEKIVFGTKRYWEKIGLTDVQFGVERVTATAAINVNVWINFVEHNITIFPENEINWNKNFEDYSERLKKKIKDLLETTI